MLGPRCAAAVLEGALWPVGGLKGAGGPGPPLPCRARCLAAGALPGCLARGPPRPLSHSRLSSVATHPEVATIQHPLHPSDVVCCVTTFLKERQCAPACGANSTRAPTERACGAFTGGVSRGECGPPSPSLEHCHLAHKMEDFYSQMLTLCAINQSYIYNQSYGAVFSFLTTHACCTRAGTQPFSPVRKCCSPIRQTRRFKNPVQGRFRDLFRIFLVHECVHGWCVIF